jgi:hypothetical protein
MADDPTRREDIGPGEHDTWIEVPDPLLSKLEDPALIEQLRLVKECRLRLRAKVLRLLQPHFRDGEFRDPGHALTLELDFEEAAELQLALNDALELPWVEDIAADLAERFLAAKEELDENPEALRAALRAAGIESGKNAPKYPRDKIVRRYVFACNTKSPAEALRQIAKEFDWGKDYKALGNCRQYLVRSKQQIREERAALEAKSHRPISAKALAELPPGNFPIPNLSTLFSPPK